MFVIIDIGCAECIGDGTPDEREQLASISTVGYPTEEAAVDALNLSAHDRGELLRTKAGHLLLSSSSGGYLVARVPTELAG